MSDLKFPIYCEDMGYYYKIHSTSEALEVCTDKNGESINHFDFESEVTVYPYNDYIANKYKEITAKEFKKAYTEVRELLDKKAKI